MYVYEPTVDNGLKLVRGEPISILFRLNLFTIQNSISFFFKRIFQEISMYTMIILILLVIRISRLHSFSQCIGKSLKIAQRLNRMSDISMLNLKFNTQFNWHKC